MKIFRNLTIYFVAAIVSATAACSVQSDARKGQPYVPYVTDQVVINELKVLNDGAGITWQLEPGHYKLEMTGSKDGAAAEWVGAGCPKTQQMKQLTMECQLSGTGQLIITNPTTFGLGKQVSVTVKVTKLSH